MDDRDEMLRQYLSTKYLTTPPEEVTPASVTTTADDNTQDLTTESTPGNTKAEAVKNDGYANASDDRGVKDAQAGRNRADLISNVGRSLSHIFTARAQANGYKPDDSVYDNIAKSGQTGVDEAQAARKSAIESYLTKRKMGQEDAATTRQSGLDADALAHQTWGESHAEDESKRQAEQFATSNARLEEGNAETKRSHLVEEEIKRRQLAAAGDKAKPQEYTDKNGVKRMGSIIGTHVIQSNDDPMMAPAPADLHDPKPNQSQAALYGTRMEQAEAAMKQLHDKGFDRTSKTTGLQSYLPGGLQPEGLKLQEQAETNFVTALLRRESGSAISSGEFSTAEKQYFPRAGDTPAVLKQKEQNRDLAIQGLKAEAGPTALGKLAPPPPAGSPAPGAVEDGFTFKGGDPSKPENWEKAQ